jgi:hypothetical protein
VFEVKLVVQVKLLPTPERAATIKKIMKYLIG